MDENKIEITVELDTSKAEKQADDLNDALVDGAKDANKEFKKYSDNVNKNLNSIKKQMDNTFNGAKLANSLTSKVGKALNGIKNKINSILGNINVKTTVNANTSSQQGSTGSSGASSMGASLVTGSAIGSQLAKALSLDKPIAQAKSLLDVFRNMANSIKTIKIGDKQFDIGESVNAISIYQRALNDTQDKHYTFGKTVDNLNDRLRKVKENLNRADVEFYDVDDAINETIKVLERLGIEGALVPKKLANSYKYMGEVLDDLLNKLHSCDNVMVDEFGKEIFDVSQFNGLKVLVNDLLKTTSGFSKFKLVVANTMMTVREVVGSAVDNIKAKMSSSTMFSPLINGIQKLKTTISSSKLGQAFTQGFKEPQKYIDNMKAKIKEWANNHKKATDKVKKANKSVGSSFKSLLKQMLPIASIYGAFNALKTSITSYADGLQQSGKFATVFGNETEDMTDWLNELNSTVTTSKSTLMDFSTNLYNMGKNMKMPTDKALDMAKSMTELGADLEAFTGDANAIDALAGALRGEYDSLQNFGYIIDANAVETRALKMGLDASTESAKALARQSIILEQSKMAGILGYSATQAQTLSGQLAMLRKNFQALGTAIGSCFAGLLQVVLPVLNSIVSAVTQAFNKLAGLINSVFGLFGVKVGASGASGGGVVGDAVGGIVDNLGSGLDGAGGDLADNLAGGAESAKEIAKGLMGIDELNVLSSDKGGSGGGSGSGSSSGGAGGAGAGSVPSLDFTTGGESITDAMTGELTEFQQAFLTVFERLKQGFILFKDDIISEWTKLKLNIDKLGQEMAEFFKSCWQNGLDDTALIFGSLISRVTATALEIANSVVEVATNLFNHLNPNSNPNTKKFINSINNLLKNIVKFVRDAGKWFDQFATACQPFINNLGDIAMIVGGILADVLADAIELVRDFMNSWAGQKAIETVGKILEEVSDALESCLGFIKDHITFFEALGLGIMGAVGAFKLINGAITIWNGLCTVFASVGAIASGVATALGGAIAFLTSPIGLVVLAIGALIAIGVALYKNWDEVKAWCSKAWDAICKGIQDAGQVMATTFDYMKTTAINKCKEIWNNIKSIWESIKNTFSTVLNGIKSLLSTVWNGITSTVKSVWNGISSYFSQVLNAIKNTINGVLNGIKTLFSGAWNAIKSTVTNTFNGIKSSISSILNGIKSTISNIVNGIKTVFSNGFNSAKSTVTSVFNGIKSSISSVLNSAKSSVSSIVSGISNSIKNGFNSAKNTVSSVFNSMKNSISSVMNSAKSIVSGAVSKIKGFFNFSWSLPKPKIPKFTAKWSTVFGVKIPTGFSISWHKDGGIFTKPTLLGNGRHGVGEAGREAVLPLSEFYKKEDERFNKLAQQLSSNNNQPIVVQVTLDGKVIAQSTVDNFKQMSRLGNLDTSWL